MTWWPEEDGVGEERNKGTSPFLFHLNTWMDGDAIHREGEDFCGRSKLRESRGQEVKETEF